MMRWQLAHGRHLDLGAKAVLMGILNVTPDSFSDGGEFAEPDGAVAHARVMMAEGAAIIDVGGESTRPGATPVHGARGAGANSSGHRSLSRPDGPLISVDTYRAETARLAVAAGAHIVNDVHGLQREPDIARVAAETGAGLVIMHTGRDREKLPDVIADQFLFLERSLEIARDRRASPRARSCSIRASDLPRTARRIFSSWPGSANCGRSVSRCSLALRASA